METMQKKSGFLGRPLITVVLVVGAIVVLIAAVTSCSVVEDRRAKQVALQAEEDMALYIINEAKLAKGEEIESITFDVIAEECYSRAVCGSLDHTTKIHIKSTQREWTIENDSYPDELWYYGFGGYDIGVGGETTDEELCFVHYAEDVYDSGWRKNLDGVTVHYDNDFPLG